MTRLLCLAAALMLSCLLAGPAACAVDERDLLQVNQAYVLTAHASSRQRIEFTWRIAPGYYLYRQRFAVQAVDAAFKTNALQLPAGIKHTDPYFGEVETYRGSVTAIQTGATAGGVSSVTFKVKYQGCADAGVCYPPQTRQISVSMPPEVTAEALLAPPAPESDAAGSSLAELGSGSRNLLGSTDALPPEKAFRVDALANSPAELLVRLDPAPGYYFYRDKTAVRIGQGQGVSLASPRWPPGKPYHDEHFGDVVVYAELAEVPVPVLRSNHTAQSIAVQVDFQGCLVDGICYPPMTRSMQVELPAGAGAAFTPQQTPANRVSRDEDSRGLLLSLLLAFLGGLVLNLMPCVLPVLSFKALGLAQASRSHAHARAHALWYTAGVLASFAAAGAAVLSLRGAGQALGWGFQLQQPWVVGSLALLMFGIGLSLSGVVQFGASLTGIGQSLTEKSGAAGDFFTGVLAVVVASPCTAPFMAGALAYAFTAPVVPAMLVFIILGLGLAAPFLLIGFIPALAGRLPRPGAWMETLRRWLAYPMYLAAVWLAWVFGKQRGVDGMALLLICAVILALAAWWYERQRLGDARVKKMLAYLLVALALGAAVFALWLPGDRVVATGAQASVPFSASELARYRAQGRPVFVDMTADWCITCKINEGAVFHTAAFQELLRRTGTLYMVGDWTNQDPAISAFLDAYHAPGVPLYVVFPAKGGAGRKLPQLLTLGLMQQALSGGQAR